jgi:hypothetical protein
VPSLRNLVDEPRDILALFGGTVITAALIVMVFMLPDIREIIVGALITIVVLIYNHFFNKQGGATDGS